MAMLDNALINAIAEEVKKRIVDEYVEPETFTIKAALKRHQGMEEKEMQEMCRRGELPGAVKKGKQWHIPRVALDSFFKASKAKGKPAS